MATSNSTSSVQPRPRYRFTIGGMFVLILGISVGLAHWRLPLASPASAMLLACGAWLVIGLAAQVVRILTAPSGDKSSWREVGWHLALLAMLMAAAVFDLAARFRWALLEGIHPDYWNSTRLLTQSILYLSIIGIYWTPRAASRWERFYSVRVWRRILDGVAVAVGIGCLSAILRNEAILHGLVYTAIHGTENYQPWRWLGQQMHPEPLATETLMAQFIGRGFAVAGLFVLFALSAALGLWTARYRRLARVVCLLVSGSCLVGTIWLLLWCRDFAVPRLSPILPPLIGYQPPGNTFLAAMFVIFAGALAATWLTSRAPTETPSANDPVSPPARLLLDDPLVLLACVLSLTAAFANDLYYAIRYDSLLAGLSPDLSWLYSPQILWAIICRIGEWLGIYDPVRLLRLAALLVMVRQTRAAWSGKPMTPAASPVPDFGQFIAAWLFSLTALLLSAPIGAWWSMALTFHYDFGF